MLLYAEGTRFTKEKQEASVKFARSKGLPELKEHLLPRTKGFSVGLPHFRHNLPAVYNVQLAFKGYLSGLRLGFVSESVLTSRNLAYDLRQDSRIMKQFIIKVDD